MLGNPSYNPPLRKGRMLSPPPFEGGGYGGGGHDLFVQSETLLEF